MRTPLSPPQKQENRGKKTPVGKVARIVARAMAGETKTAIAKAEGVDRKGVAAILNDSEVAASIKEGQSRLYDLMPLAVQAMRKAMQRGNVQATLGYLSGMQVFVPKSQVRQTTPIDEMLERADLSGRSEQDMKFFLQNGTWPEDAQRFKPN